MDVGHDNLVLNLRRIARQRQWSMNRIADAAGVARGSLSDILAKHQSPTLATLQKLADGLEVAVSELLSSPHEASAKGPLRRLDARGGED